MNEFEGGTTRGERVKRVKDDANKLWTELGDVRDSAERLISDARTTFGDIGQVIDLDRRIRENPIGTVAVAAGVGFVLGGGLLRPLASRAIGLGIRLALIPYLKSAAITYVADVVRGHPAGYDGEGDLADAGRYTGDRDEGV